MGWLQAKTFLEVIPTNLLMLPWVAITLVDRFADPVAWRNLSTPMVRKAKNDPWVSCTNGSHG
jgi:hypothetical protein